MNAKFHWNYISVFEYNSLQVLNAFLDIVTESFSIRVDITS